MSMSLIVLAKFIGIILIYLIMGVIAMTITMAILANTNFGKKIVKKLMKGGKESV